MAALRLKIARLVNQVDTKTSTAPPPAAAPPPPAAAPLLQGMADACKITPAEKDLAAKYLKIKTKMWQHMVFAKRDNDMLSKMESDNAADPRASLVLGVARAIPLPSIV